MRTKLAGSSTAIIMQLDQRNRTLVVANLVRKCVACHSADRLGCTDLDLTTEHCLSMIEACLRPAQGDSGFIIIRGGRILARSRPLQHYFDCPMQFGAFPEFVEATDTADMAEQYVETLRPGDIIVAGAAQDAVLSQVHGRQLTSNIVLQAATGYGTMPSTVRSSACAKRTRTLSRRRTQLQRWPGSTLRTLTFTHLTFARPRLRGEPRQGEGGEAPPHGQHD